MSGDQYIEEFWQKPKFEDLDAAAAGKPLTARFKSCTDNPETLMGELIGYHAGVNPWIIAVGPSRSTYYREDLQVYRLPRLPSGYEFIDTKTATPQKDDIRYYNGKWYNRFEIDDNMNFVVDTVYARRIVPKPYDGYELIDTNTENPSATDLFWNNETKAWHVRVPGAIVSFIPDVFYCRKKQPVRVEYSFEEANELTGKKLFIDNGKCKVSVLISKITHRNDGKVIVNDYYQSYLIKYAVIQMDAKSQKTIPFGKELKQ